MAFFVCSPGGSATAWLSKTFNLYDDRVFCSHGLNYLDLQRHEHLARSEVDLITNILRFEHGSHFVFGNIHGLFNCRKHHRLLSESGCRVSALVRSPEDRAMSKLRIQWANYSKKKGVLGFNGLFPARWIPTLTVLRQFYLRYGVFEQFCCAIDRILDNLKKLMAQDDEFVTKLELKVSLDDLLLFSRWENKNILHFTYALHLFTDIEHDKINAAMLGLDKFHKMEDVTTDLGGFRRLIDLVLGKFASDNKIDHLFQRSKTVVANRRSMNSSRGQILRQMHISDDFIKNMTIQFINIHKMKDFYSAMGYYDKIVLDSNYAF